MADIIRSNIIRIDLDNDLLDDIDLQFDLYVRGTLRDLPTQDIDQIKMIIYESCVNEYNRLRRDVRKGAFSKDFSIFYKRSADRFITPVKFTRK